MTQNSIESEDLRVRRTRKLLQEALIELTVEKGFAAVTVSDITERAMVNRSTFYRHYVDKYDLLDHYMKDLWDLTAHDEFVKEKFSPTGERPNGLVLLLRHIQQYAEFFRVMLGANGDAGFIQKFRQIPERRYRYLLSQVDTPANELPVEFRLSYLSSAGIGAILWWLDSGQPCSVEQLAQWLSQVSSGVAGLPFAVPKANE